VSVKGFEKRAHKAVEELIQGDIYHEFTEQIRAEINMKEMI